VGSTTPIDPEDSLSPLGHFTEHLEVVYEKLPPENNFDHKFSRLSSRRLGHTQQSLARTQSKKNSRGYQTLDNSGAQAGDSSGCGRFNRTENKAKLWHALSEAESRMARLRPKNREPAEKSRRANDATTHTCRDRTTPSKGTPTGEKLRTGRKIEHDRRRRGARFTRSETRQRRRFREKNQHTVAQRALRSKQASHGVPAVKSCRKTCSQVKNPRRDEKTRRPAVSRLRKDQSETRLGETLRELMVEEEAARSGARRREKTKPEIEKKAAPDACNACEDSRLDPTAGQANSQTSTRGGRGTEHWSASRRASGNKKMNKSAVARPHEKTGARTEKEIEELD
jgi:hypothetical protein